MKKLMLELDALRVESFETTAAGAARAGTVRAHWNEMAFGVEEAAPEEEAAVKTDLCSLGCSEGCSIQTCPTGTRSCCV
jgi:hypothetical protein